MSNKLRVREKESATAREGESKKERAWKGDRDKELDKERKSRIARE